jgi:hypothetical protein
LLCREDRQRSVTFELKSSQGRQRARTLSTWKAMELLLILLHYKVV